MNALKLLLKVKKNTKALKDFYYETKKYVYDKVKIYCEFEIIMKNVYVDIYINSKYEEITNAYEYLNRYIDINTNGGIISEAKPPKLSGLTVERIYNNIAEEINYGTCKKCRAKSQTPICPQCRADLGNKIVTKIKDKTKDQFIDAVKDSTITEIEEFAYEHEIGWLEKSTKIAKTNIFKFIFGKTSDAVKTITLNKALAMAGASIVIGGAVGTGVTYIATKEPAQIEKEDDFTKNGIQIQEYVDTLFKGYDGYGYVETSFNKEKFEAALLYFYADNDDEMFAYNISQFVESLSIEPVNNVNLSNGDKFIATIHYNKELYKELDIAKLDFQIEEEVLGLPVPKNIDVFEHIFINCNGITGNEDNYISTEYLDSEVDYSGINLSFSKTKGLENGDTITAYISIEDMSNFVNTYGFIIEKTESEIVLDGFDYYVTSPEEIDNETWELMQQHAKDELTSYFTAEYFTVENIKIHNNLFITPKSGTGNKLISVCEATIIGLDDKRYENVYWYISFNSILNTDMGININYNNSFIPSGYYQTPGTQYSLIYTARDSGIMFGYKIAAYYRYEILLQDIKEIYDLYDIVEIN